MKYTGTWRGKACSVNRWHGARRIGNRAMIYETREYKDFKADLITQLPRTKLPDGYYDLALSVTLWKMFDTANVLKPVQDALVLAGIIKDDRYIRNVSVLRDYHKRGEPDTITVSLRSVDHE